MQLTITEFLQLPLTIPPPAPCAPQGVTYSSSVLSWDAAVFATHYTVYDTSGGSRVTLCHTADLSCNLADLDVGATELTASIDMGESAATTNIAGRLTTGCVVYY